MTGIVALKMSAWVPAKYQVPIPPKLKPVTTIFSASIVNCDRTLSIRAVTASRT